MRFFFYGTLLDPDVRTAVLGPARGRSQGSFATLPGYVRRRARHGDYPVLVRRSGRWVVGEVFDDLSAREVSLIAHFEGRSYAPVRKTVLGRDHRERLSVWVFLPARPYDATGRPWVSGTWARRGKPILLHDIRRWSREFNVGTLRSQDIAWPTRRTLARLLEGTEA